MDSSAGYKDHVKEYVLTTYMMIKVLNLSLGNLEVTNSYDLLVNNDWVSHGPVTMNLQGSPILQSFCRIADLSTLRS